MLHAFSGPKTGAFLLLATLGSLGFRPPSAAPKLYVADYENVLGTSFEIKLAAAADQPAATAEAAALREVDRLNKILSGYNASSEFSRWLAAGRQPVAVSPELYDVLALFEQWRVKSDGALDASAETVSQLWHTAAQQNRQPSAAEIAAAVAAVRQPHYVLDAQHHTAQRLSAAPLRLNSFAKSYILNKAAEAALATPGVSGLVVNLGGDILVRGAHTEQIRVSNPRADAENDPPVAQLQVHDKTIATSGDYRRGEQIGGQWYSHIVDPRTGRPAGEVISATVVADQATDAGALATALNVLPPAEGQALVAAVPGAEYMLITASGQRLESAGWKALELPAAPPAAAKALPASVKGKPWDAAYEVALTLELATQEGARTHRPFVAVWVVDAQKKPVRQLALWYNKPKYLNDMRFWYATYYDQFAAGNNNVSSTTSATRSPGKYTLKWDGKDDQGNPVAQGTYTLFVEVAREHGTHQLLKQAIDTKKPQHFDLPANAEVASAAVDYRKKADDK